MINKMIRFTILIRRTTRVDYIMWKNAHYINVTNSGKLSPWYLGYCVTFIYDVVLLFCHVFTDLAEKARKLRSIL